MAARSAFVSVSCVCLDAFHSDRWLCEFWISKKNDPVNTMSLLLFFHGIVSLCNVSQQQSDEGFLRLLEWFKIIVVYVCRIIWACLILIIKAVDIHQHFVVLVQYVTLVQVFAIGWEQIKRVNKFLNQALFSSNSCNYDHVYQIMRKMCVCVFPSNKMTVFCECRLVPEILFSSIYTYIHVIYFLDLFSRQK